MVLPLRGLGTRRSVSPCGDVQGVHGPSQSTSTLACLSTSLTENFTTESTSRCSAVTLGGGDVIRTNRDSEPVVTRSFPLSPKSDYSPSSSTHLEVSSSEDTYYRQHVQKTVRRQTEVCRHHLARPPFKLREVDINAVLAYTSARLVPEAQSVTLPNCLFTSPKVRRYEEIDSDGDPHSVTLGRSHPRKVRRVERHTDIRRSTRQLISKLKQQHVCAVHLRENNEPGLCFVSPSGIHIHLEDDHLTIWASALLADEDCTISVPPKSTGLMDTPGSVRSATHSRSTGLLDTPFGGRPSDPSAFYAMQTEYNLPPRIRSTEDALNIPLTSTPSTPVKAKTAFVFTSPDITPNDNVRRLLADFAQHRGIDIQSELPVIEDQGLGPQSILAWSKKTLSRLTGISEELVVELQAFCGEWIDGLQRKRGLL
ncbi:uncharacterized protein STEHIDRAFT_116792 [Stereum hirsutum FP-91666 SS1]|uniref:Uncharacterized protein n=1 Tax=Stereum hirsutum (strain FP-91666) TaxID=721885 RepID=R7RVL7_STEHR|nr:uncharacterized protein STEHIDRAFT_116792 [Stereum hirsutum FP-91666 SS1]EIM79109.1 hypothetical protein STEHIDRAFT_116792 [Stereum hirsutum FP-91666 SS1]